MKTFIFLFVMILSQTFAQWQPDFRLTTSSANSYISMQNARCIAANGPLVHVVYYDYRDGNWEIYYKRSADNGLNWATGLRLTNNSAVSVYPSVTATGTNIHVVWADDRNGNMEIYYKRSLDDGISWGSDIRLTNQAGNKDYPCAAVSGSNIHVAWDDNRDGNYDIYYKRSTDNGISWGSDTRLTNNTSGSNVASIDVSGSVVHVVWYDDRDGNDEIYYKRSPDGGTNWGLDTRLTNNSASSNYSCVSVSGSNVQVVWRDYRDGNYEIYYKRSTDGGISWESDTRLTNNSFESSAGFVTVSGSNVHVVWHDYRDGNYEIYYKRSTDGGISWESDTRLTYNSSTSFNPFITVSGPIVHVVWEDARNGNFSIYYKQNPTGNPIGIKNISTEIPEKFSLYQNYPNPFNPVTKIRFSIPSPSSLPLGLEMAGVRLIIYDILGREVATLVNEELKPGTYEVDWDGTNYSSGVYYYSLTAGNYFDTKNFVLIK